MIQLSLEQYDVLQRYYELLGTVEEGFEYVVSSFEDISHSNADQVLVDIFAALSSIYQTNDHLLSLFKDQKEIVASIHFFNGVITEISKLENSFENEQKKQQFIKSNIYPAFQAWKESIQDKLSIYVVQ
ncbi:hypothetical protein E1I69_11690 [Bacillus timonensis]|uniref:DUF8042 domain-containing protein n=1 Tax=Bacillus timonensis TaxID=1033734 RepID=A0A4S3PSS7_9BACI|nr:hypothetical protein [Bacillus timonensis]THE12356.1 hypothetical protein E1I69_11690 [Bacillus timonensis]